MICSNCGGVTRVIDSRREDELVNRLRICRTCGYRFRTIEIEREVLEELKKEAAHDS